MSCTHQKTLELVKAGDLQASVLAECPDCDTIVRVSCIITSVIHGEVGTLIIAKPHHEEPSLGTVTILVHQDHGDWDWEARYLT